MIVYEGFILKERVTDVVLVLDAVLSTRSCIVYSLHCRANKLGLLKL